MAQKPPNKTVLLRYINDTKKLIDKYPQNISLKHTLKRQENKYNLYFSSGEITNDIQIPSNTYKNIQSTKKPRFTPQNIQQFNRFEYDNRFLHGTANSSYTENGKVIDTNLCLFFSIGNALKYANKFQVTPISSYKAYQMKKMVNSYIFNADVVYKHILINLDTNMELNNTTHKYKDEIQNEVKRVTTPNNNKFQEDSTVAALALIYNIRIDIYAHRVLTNDGQNVYILARYAPNPDKTILTVSIYLENYHYMPLYPITQHNEINTL